LEARGVTEDKKRSVTMGHERVKFSGGKRFGVEVESKKKRTGKTGHTWNSTFHTETLGNRKKLPTTVGPSKVVDS